MHVYRYTFDESVSFDDVDATFALSIIAAECLYGQAVVRIEAGCASDPETRRIVIDGDGKVGRAVNLLFVGFMSAGLGPDCFKLETIPKKTG